MAVTITAIPEYRNTLVMSHNRRADVITVIIAFTFCFLFNLLKFLLIKVTGVHMEFGMKYKPIKHCLVIIS